MLVLSRKALEQIRIGDHITVTVIRIGNNSVRLGIDAPRDVAVHRQEVLEAILNEKLKFSSEGSEQSSDTVAQ